MGSLRANGRRARWLLGVLVGIGVLSIVVTPAIEGGVAEALPMTSQPHLTLNRLIRTSPFQNSATSLRDNEGNAYVAKGNALWLASDNDNALFEVNRTTGALRRRIPQAAFINARRFGGGPRAGQARTQDLEALAYNAEADVLYAFSGNKNATPTAFRLIRTATTGSRSRPGSRCRRHGPARVGGRPTVAPMPRTDRPSEPMPSTGTVSGPRFDPGPQWDRRPRLRQRDR